MDYWANATVGGQKLPQISHSQMASMNWRQQPAETISANLEEHFSAWTAKAKDHFVMNEEMDNYIYEVEKKTIQETITWRFSSVLLEEEAAGPQQKMMAMMQLAGMIIQKNPNIQVYDGSVGFNSGTHLFLNNGMGRYFITFDPEFPLCMKAAENGAVKQDIENGIKAAYCIEYSVTASAKGKPDQFNMHGAGIVFVQHCVKNQNRLFTLAHFMSERVSSHACSAARDFASNFNMTGTSPSAPAGSMKQHIQNTAILPDLIDLRDPNEVEVHEKSNNDAIIEEVIVPDGTNEVQVQEPIISAFWDAECAKGNMCAKKQSDGAGQSDGAEQSGGALQSCGSNAVNNDGTFDSAWEIVGNQA